MIIVLAFETPSRQEAPQVIYAGTDGEEALAAIAECKLPRIERLDHPATRTVRAYSEPVKEPVKEEDPAMPPEQEADADPIEEPAAPAPKPTKKK